MSTDILALGALPCHASSGLSPGVVLLDDAALTCQGRVPAALRPVISADDTDDAIDAVPVAAAARALAAPRRVLSAENAVEKLTAHQALTLEQLFLLRSAANHSGCQSSAWYCCRLAPSRMGNCQVRTASHARAVGYQAGYTPTAVR